MVFLRQSHSYLPQIKLFLIAAILYDVVAALGTLSSALLLDSVLNGATTGTSVMVKDLISFALVLYSTL